MVTIAVSVAALAYLVAHVEAGFSAAIGFGLLLAMVIGHYGGQQATDRLATEARMAELARANGELAHDLAELARRVDRFDTLAVDQARALTAPLSGEIGQLGALVKQFAETLQVHEAAIVRLGANAQPAAASAAPPAVQQAAPEPVTAPPEAAPGEPAPAASGVSAPAAGRAVPSRLIETLRQRLDRAEPAPAAAAVLPPVFEGLTRAEAIASISGAIDARRVDLYLQPIVTLPQRKVRWYQASVRLRIAAGDLLQPAEYRDIAEPAGLMPALDIETVSRCIQVVKRLTSRNRDVGLVCDIAGASLSDAAFASELIALLDSNRALAGSLVIGLRQATMRNLAPLDGETLGALADLGFRFALDAVTDLRFEPRDVAAQGFRQVKVPVDLLLGHPGQVGTAIHPADLAGLFARYGVDFIVEGVESEPQVVDLLDHDVRFAQGALFSPARPVRAEVLGESVA
ncbi:EAL domain-containing protein, partial [Phreatobacter sp. AB_2022a]|uniref:EAL domain-containing protein n=1 Tax=Phreatobacter sp. AB_2022a TaxID=3003134 RepID=UPI00228756B6